MMNTWVNTVPLVLMAKGEFNMKNLGNDLLEMGCAYTFLKLFDLTLISVSTLSALKFSII